MSLKFGPFEPNLECELYGTRVKVAVWNDDGSGELKTHSIEGSSISEKRKSKQET